MYSLEYFRKLIEKMYNKNPTSSIPVFVYSSKNFENKSFPSYKPYIYVTFLTWQDIMSQMSLYLFLNIFFAFYKLKSKYQFKLNS